MTDPVSTDVCNERHTALGDKLTALTGAMEKLTDKLAAVVERRAAERAWGILGKLVVGLGGAWLVLDRVAESLAK